VNELTPLYSFYLKVSKAPSGQAMNLLIHPLAYGITSLGARRLAFLAVYDTMIGLVWMCVESVSREPAPKRPVEFLQKLHKI
jgi:hypothetical protein